MEKALIEWNESYSVQVEELDNQHKQLIKMVNDLYVSLINKETEDMTGKIIAKMADYAIIHFVTEEKYFHKFGYEDAKNHANEHKVFMRKVEEFQNEYKRDSSVLTIRVLDFLKEWLKHHILISDHKYIDCITNPKPQD